MGDFFAPQHIMIILLLLAVPILIIILLIRFLINRGGRTSKNSASLFIADELGKLNQLYEKGVITKEELEKRKSKLL
jgi:uncharacterized membrane protein